MARGRLEKIWLKRFKGGPMDEVSEARLVPDRGLAGNANQGGKRQVTLIEQEVWQCLSRELGTELDPAARRANLLVSGLGLRDCRQRFLRIGTSKLLLWGETRPCAQMDESFPGLKALLYSDWRGGAFGEVVEGGVIRAGDWAEWIEE